MPKKTKERLVELTPKTDSAKAKLGYHGIRWVLRAIVEVVRFSREKNWYQLMSLDGKKAIFVKVEDDPDFTVRAI